MAQDGPDVWITVQVPEGFHRFSLYLFNKDGHDNTNRYRDYLIQIKQGSKSSELHEKFPNLAQARVINFWGGVYQQFALHGPSQYLVRVSRNSSFNTIVCGVFLDYSSQPFFSLPTLSVQKSYQILNYRVAAHEGKPALLLAKLRAVLQIWTMDDRKAFGVSMAKSWQERLVTQYTSDHPFVTIVK